MSPNITTVIINYMTPDLTRRAVMSFRHWYPDHDLLLIDNGSSEVGRRDLKELCSSAPARTRIIFNMKNIHHGPAMDQAARYLDSELILFLDSDVEVRRAGFIEEMSSLLHGHPQNYAVGKKIIMNDRGFDLPEGTDGYAYVRPICLLLKRDLYLTLPPFQRHGAPCLQNMQHAVEKGLALLDFPISKYVHHAGRGTASRHGYRLGWRGKLNQLLHRLGL
jgi:hypothetical protein